MGNRVLFSKRPRLISCFIVIAVLILTIGCGDDGERTVVDFSEAVSMDDTRKPSSEAALRVAIASMVSPKETEIIYQKILEYIGVELNRHIEIIQGRNYSELNELFDHAQIDLAFIGSGPYATG